MSYPRLSVGPPISFPICFMVFELLSATITMSKSSFARYWVTTRLSHLLLGK
jgi:hypothetical protein